MEIKMIKYTIFLAVILGTSVAAFSAIAPEATRASKPGNVTVIYKNQNWEIGGPIIVEHCALEDCSDTPQS